MTVLGVAVAATGIAVSSGIAAQSPAPADSASAALSAARADHSGGASATAGLLGSARPSEAGPAKAGPSRVDVNRGSRVSRSARRTAIDEKKQRTLRQRSGGQATRTEDLSHHSLREIARILMPKYGFSTSQFGCLNDLWISESSWDPHADNPTSTAYGIPQALIGDHANLPADYKTNPVSQIRWGLGYIRDAYGTPCSAWAFKQSHHWY